MRILVFCLTLLLAGRSWAAPSIVPTEGFNLRIVALKGETISAAPATTGYAHNWFAARLRGLTPRAQTTLVIEMAGNDVAGNKMNVGKWRGLRPLYTYADPTSYDAYVGYWRDAQGRWWSFDPFVSERERYAGNAIVPVQRAMVAALSPAFLREQGAQWFPWQEIETAQPGANNSFVIKQTFALPSASVAMRVPYTNAYLAAYVARLKAANRAGVTVDEVGRSAANRPLWCIRVEDPAGLATGEKLKTVVIFAREHATEHATSWTAQGVLERLIDRSVEMDELRRHVRFLIVPIQDPDGVARSRFNNLTENWDDPKNNSRLKEVLAYSAYFRDFADAGQTLDVAVSLHNVEANEAPNVSTPFAQSQFRQTTTEFNRALFEQLKENGYTVASPTPGGSGVMSTRLYGWLSLHLGAMDMAYEVNDRDPENRLSIEGLQHIGGIFAGQIGAWMTSEAGDKRHAAAQLALEKRAQARQKYLADNKNPPEEEKQFNLTA